MDIDDQRKLIGDHAQILVLPEITNVARAVKSQFGQADRHGGGTVGPDVMHDAQLEVTEWFHVWGIVQVLGIDGADPWRPCRLRVVGRETRFPW